MNCKVIPELDHAKVSKLIIVYGFFDGKKQIGKCAVKEYTRGENAGSYYLQNVSIDEKYRGQGLCSKFLKCVLKRYSGKTVYLDVLIDNIPAVKCYTSLGFVEVERGRKTIWMRKGN